jgi:hypothetical protein
VGRLALLYIGGDIVRPDRGQRQAASVAPGEEPGARPRVRPARVRVADVGGEEFDIAPAGGIAGGGDQRRHQAELGVGRQRVRRDDGPELRGRIEVVGWACGRFRERVGSTHVHGLYHESHA